MFGAFDNYSFFADNKLSVSSRQGGIDANTVLMAQFNNNATDTEIAGTPKTATTNLITYTNLIYPYSSAIYTAIFNGIASYVTYPAHADWNFGSGNFTIDFYMKSTTSNTTRTVLFGMGDLTAGTNHYIYWDLNDGGNYLIVKNSSGQQYFGPFSSNGTYTNSAWHHLAVIRNGSTITGTIDGVSVGTINASNYTFNMSSYVVSIGIGSLGDGFYFGGNIAGVRISKGIARWTANFTPPSAPYTT